MIGGEDVFLRLFLATILGLIIGLERSLAGKNAGMRTHALVALGSALFIVIGVYISSAYNSTYNFDPLRILAAIISGIGFIGAGLIVLRKDESLRGLTTAAGLWVAAAVGASAGFALYDLAIFVTTLTVFVFTGLWFAEHKIKKWWQNIFK